jgi:hypothetical protein
LCGLLKTWGKCSEEMIEYMREQRDELSTPDKISATLAKALNPDTLRDMMTEQRAKKLA